MVAVAVIMQIVYVYNLLIEATYLFILSMFAVIAFALYVFTIVYLITYSLSRYAFLLYLRAKRLNIDVKNRDMMLQVSIDEFVYGFADLILQKLKWIAIVVCVCDVSHCLYLVIVDVLSQYVLSFYFCV